MPGERTGATHDGTGRTADAAAVGARLRAAVRVVPAAVTSSGSASSTMVASDGDVERPKWEDGVGGDMSPLRCGDAGRLPLLRGDSGTGPALLARGDTGNELARGDRGPEELARGDVGAAPIAEPEAVRTGRCGPVGSATTASADGRTSASALAGSDADAESGRTGELVRIGGVRVPPPKRGDIRILLVSGSARWPRRRTACRTARLKAAERPLTS